MKALVKAKRQAGIWLQEEPMPEYGVNDALIKVHKTAICGTDIHIYKWDDWAKATIPVPMIIGHEFYGEIAALGTEVKGFELGQRVSGEGHITCGYCRNCRAGTRHLCPKTLGLGVNRPGCFSEYFSLPASNLIALPETVCPDHAAILDPFGNATHCALSFDVVGEDVLITGAGPIGIMAAAILRHIGAKNVVITDVNPYRLALAEKMGAHAVNVQDERLESVMEKLKIKEGFNVGLEMSGQAQAFNNLLEVMNYGGHVALLGILPPKTAIDWNLVIFKCLTIKGIYGREMFETWHKMIAMLQSGLKLSPVITHHFSLDSYQEAFEIMASGQTGKVIIDWL